MIKIKDHDITAIKTTYGDIVKVVTKIGNEVKVLWEQSAPEPEGLPAEYQQVEYIASNLEAYIDTKISIVPDLLAEMDLSFANGSETDHGVYINNKRFHVGIYSRKYILGIGSKYQFANETVTPDQKRRFALYNGSSPYAEVDGTRYTGFTQFTETATFLLFRKKPEGDGLNNLKRVYWAKFSVGDTVLGEFIPCYRKSDGKTGMYNLVTKEFLTSLTSSDFEKGPDVINFEDTYQKVEYIESDGQQWIDLGVKFNTTTKLTCDFQFTTDNLNKGVLGAEVGGNAFILWALNYGIQTVTGDGVRSQLIYSYASITQRHTVVIDATDNTAQADSYDVQSISSSNTTLTSKLFGVNWGGTSTGYLSNMKLYSLQWEDSTGNLLDLIPCYRKSDSVIGLYNTVNGEFLINQGSGNFTKGPDVNN